MIHTGTRVIDVYAEQVTGGVIIVKCMFQVYVMTIICISMINIHFLNRLPAINT